MILFSASILCLVFASAFGQINNETMSAQTTLKRQSIEVYWESYLTFPNDPKSCREKKSDQIFSSKVKRNIWQSEKPFGFDLVRFCNSSSSMIPSTEIVD
jgi:hypothetical protein